jgi:hypothetical protein
MASRVTPIVPRAERVHINKEFASVDAFINEYVANISHSGVFIRSKDPLPVGTRVALKFTVIMDELETIEGIGEVVRRSSKPAGMGVVFVELTGFSQDLIAKLITQRAKARREASKGKSSEREKTNGKGRARENTGLTSSRPKGAETGRETGITAAARRRR